MKAVFVVLIFLMIPSIVSANSPPVLETLKPQALQVGKEFAFLIGNTDPDQDTLKLTDDSDLFDITSTGSIKFTPKSEDMGIKEFVITAFDGEFTVSAKGVFIINKNLTETKTETQIIRANLKGSSNISKTLAVFNTKPETLNLVLESSFDQGLWKQIQIEGNSEKAIDVFLKSDGYVDTGSIKIYGGIKEKVIPVIITRSSENFNLGLNVDIAAKFRNIDPGQEIAADIIVVNLDKKRKDNISILYIIKDLQNNVITQASEEISVENELRKTKKMLLPSFVGGGEYVFGAILEKGGAASSAELFTVSSGYGENKTIEYVPSNIQIMISVVIIILVGILLYLNYGRLTEFEKKKDIQVKRIYDDFLKDQESIDKSKETKIKLKKQLESLDNAYKMKLISESSYKRGRKRVEGFIRKVDSNIKQQ